jgi:hypothetical protein
MFVRNKPCLLNKRTHAAAHASKHPNGTAKASIHNDGKERVVLVHGKEPHTIDYRNDEKVRND